jgi:teichuronic acid biosynthesis glycosyltransferase TuaC
MNVLIMTAIYPTQENPAFGSFVYTQIKALQRSGIEVDVLVLRGRFRKLIYLKGISELRRRLAAGKFDVVHAHYGYVGMIARTQWKVPVVVTFHGDDLLGTINGHGTKTFSSDIIIAAGKKLAEHCQAAIVQTAEMAAKLKKDNVYVIPHEVDLDLFKPVDREQARSELGLDKNQKYLLFAANPRIPVKRFPLAKAVADSLAEKDPTVHLVTVYKEPQKRLALYMSACDVLVFPSYQEGSPNIVKQAMACNLPIVATDVGDVRQVIGGSEGCYVCAPNVAEFATRVTEILASCRRTTGRDQVRHLDCPRVSARIIDVYEHVLRRNRAAGISQGNLFSHTKYSANGK